MRITRVQLFSALVTDKQPSRLRSLGVPMDEPVRNQAWGCSAVVRDPDGNRLVIQTTTAD